MTDKKLQNAIDLRNELEEIEGAARTLITKLNQFIEGEITYDEYREWIDANEHIIDILNQT